MQTQIRLGRLEDENIIKYRMESPWNMFLQVDDNFIQGGLIYWFAYSIGKIKNAAWGFFDHNNNQLTIVGACQFSLAELLPILSQHKKNNYLYVASGLENRISVVLNKYIKKPTSGSSLHFPQYKQKRPSTLKQLRKININKLSEDRINRIDMMGPSKVQLIDRLENLGLSNEEVIDYFLYTTDLIKIFLESIQQNKDLITTTINNSCPLQNKCSKESYQPSCEVYYYGTDPYIDPKDRRYDESMILE